MTESRILELMKLWQKEPWLDLVLMLPGRGVTQMVDHNNVICTAVNWWSKKELGTYVL